MGGFEEWIRGRLSDPLLFSVEDAVDDSVWGMARADRSLM